MNPLNERLYETRVVKKVCSITHARLDYLVRVELVEPVRTGSGRGYHHLYTAQEMAVIRALVISQSLRLSIPTFQRIAQAVRWADPETPFAYVELEPAITLAVNLNRIRAEVSSKLEKFLPAPSESGKGKRTPR